MAEYKRNGWVIFLRQYGPVAGNDAMFDEHVRNAARRNGVRAPKLDTGGTLEEIVANFSAAEPKSVVLTGTAGDGKTWLCREVWLRLGGDMKTWDSDALVRTLPLACGATLVVLKDLSEMHLEASKQVVKMSEAIFTHLPREVFLVAANDGQLRSAWEKAPRVAPTVDAAARIIEDLLVRSVFKTVHAGLWLYNLSRQSSAALMNRALDALLEHEGWSGCEGCQGKRDEGSRCPVWANQARARDPLFRERLTDLLTLCDESGLHLPLRQLLMLASNMLLGLPDEKNAARVKDDLLRCQEVEGVLKAQRAHRGAIYRNVFGENLPEARRDNVAVFEALRRFGIGEETSNRLDSLLVYGHDDPELQPQFASLLEADQEYGANADFERSLRVYLEGGEPEGVTPFTEVAVAQRQRLFFTMPRDRVAELGLWELTVFRYAGEFLNGVLRPLRERRRVEDSILRPLVRGLNRVFTGRLTEEQQTLWLASSGSHSQARVCRIFEFNLDVRGDGRGVSLRLHEERPALVVLLGRIENTAIEEALPLHLVRFEFLRRVAEGALPSNFSRECYEDILTFKSRLLAARQKLDAARAQFDGEERPRTELQLLSLDREGKLQKRPVELASEVQP